MPRKYLLFITAAVFLSPRLLWAGDISKQLSTENSDVVETDEEMGAESLNRIAGKVDTGFAPRDKTYESPNHYKPGPQGHEKAMEKKFSKSD